MLPLYLALLGGLFAVGDLALARLRGQVLDRAASWVRPGGPVPPGAMRTAYGDIWEGAPAGRFGWYGMKLGDISDSSLQPLRSWGVAAEDNSGIAADENAGVPTQGNGWVGFYQGVSFVSAAVPFWVGLLDAPQTASAGQDDGSRTPSVWRVCPDHPGWNDSGDVSWGRRYIFTRRVRYENMADPPPDRCFSMEAEAGSGTKAEEEADPYLATVWDVWPCVAGLVEVSPRPIGPRYDRNASMLVLGEQRSGVSQ